MSRFLALLLVLTLIIPGFTFAENMENTSMSQVKELERIIEKFQPKLEEERVKLEDKLGESFNDDDEVRIIVELKSDPSIVYATERNMSYGEMSKTSLNSIENQIMKEQEGLKNAILSKKVDMEFINSFNTAFNGFSGKVKFEDIKVIESLPQVNKVYISNEYNRPEIKPDMDTSHDMIGSLPTWDLGYKGEGTVVAIIDTGIDPSHRDMVLSEETLPRLTTESLVGKNLLGRYYTEKVPYGYNYYDLNNEILDLGPDASMHGMHVAGTAGANGDTENGGIKGVAPESQLLAMKVFSNDPIYATTFSDIYLVAIDEAIRLGADVLNMSLGSTASFYMPESAEDIAITNATNNGIVCSVSAGNSGSMTYGWTGTNSGYPWPENPDIGVVGAPGLNKNTIQVASIENTYQKSNQLSYIKNGEEKHAPMAIAGNIDPLATLQGPQEFVDGQDGSPQFLTDVAGKVVLVVRGGNTGPFVDKIQNAQDAGAIGIIVRNHAAGGEELINMATPDVHTIPAVFVGYTAGMELLGLEEKLVEFSDEMASIPNPTAGQMSAFTSWGTTPSLELKPEITAPGGKIYSTLNDDKYGTMSGTSMAAPHVSGGSALVMEYIKEHDIYGGLSLGEQTRLAKVLLMNTAIVTFDQYDTEYSPRRQGAGVMDLYGAVSTPVRVVDATTNEAKVELKDFENTEFTMRFRAINDSNTDATYAVDVAVLADYIHPVGLNLLVSDYIYDATIDAPDSITVPANGEYEFEVTVDIGTDSTIYRNMFVEGFVTLTDLNDENPTLSVPYLGFYGNWGEPKILDGMRFIDPAGSSYFNASGMLYWTAEGDGYYYTTPHIYMNPGTVSGYILGTGNIMPYLSFMRNAESVNYNILDGEGNLLRTILMQQYKRKNYINGGNNGPVGMVSAAEWDGVINGRVVPDGDYFYEITAKIHYDGAETQSKRIPITVDTVGPEVTDLTFNPQTNKITWNSTDGGIGVYGFTFTVNDTVIEDIVYAEEGKTTYELDIKQYIQAAGNYNIKVQAADKLLNFNVGSLDFVVNNAHPYIYILEPGLLEIYDTSEILFSGYVANLSLLDKVLVNNVEADVEFMENVTIYHPDDPSTVIYTGPAFKFEKTVTIEDGYQQIKVEAVSQTGATSSLVRRFYVDTRAPELEVRVNSIDNEEKTAELEITMRDNLGYLELFLGDSQIYVYDYPLVIVEPANQTITHTVNLVNGDNSFVFTLRDGAGHETVNTTNIPFDTGEEPDPEEPIISNIEPSTDVELSPGGSFNISFNAPTGGTAYYRILLPINIRGNSFRANSLGTPMPEGEAGLYTATWFVPSGFVASNLQVEVIYVDAEGVQTYGIAAGKVTVIGAMEEVPVNSVIIGDEAFDMDYLNTDAYAQSKLIEWYNSGSPVYIKLNNNTIVDDSGRQIGIESLPTRLIHHDIFGETRIFEK
ncbi:S8 family serine peptidase [Tissierella sp.]|uniref:S8 family serine peptidase n=1 Tax=Tissierella sp. TaxID=41274 RepID=UPI00285CD2FD|nr:S8 family serine peptidase [Tissierella sp.]MDR7857505.1 S8 family serine peptidase [Tissierella sp.]